MATVTRNQVEIEAEITLTLSVDEARDLVYLLYLAKDTVGRITERERGTATDIRTAISIELNS